MYIVLEATAFDHGKAKERQSIAKKLKALGIPLNLIAEATGLAESEVEARPCSVAIPVKMIKAAGIHLRLLSLYIITQACIYNSDARNENSNSDACNWLLLSLSERFIVFPKWAMS